MTRIHWDVSCPLWNFPLIHRVWEAPIWNNFAWTYDIYDIYKLYTMYVCMYACMHGWMDGCIVCMYVCIHIYIYMYTYLYIYIDLQVDHEKKYKTTPEVSTSRQRYHTAHTTRFFLLSCGLKHCPGQHRLYCVYKRDRTCSPKIAT